MTRNLTAGFITEATANSNRPAIFFEATFISATIRLWTGIGDITWNSLTWLGNGWLGLPSGGDETEELQATGMQILLTGVPQAIISLVLQEIKQGAAGTLYLGFLDSSGAVIADPYPIFIGKADTATINEGIDSASISITYESKMIDFERSKEFRYTLESQRYFFPADTGFRYVSFLQDWTGFWGQQKNKPEKKKKRRRR